MGPGPGVGGATARPRPASGGPAARVRRLRGRGRGRLCRGGQPLLDSRPHEYPGPDGAAIEGRQPSGACAGAAEGPTARHPALAGTAGNPGARAAARPSGASTPAVDELARSRRGSGVGTGGTLCPALGTRVVLPGGEASVAQERGPAKPHGGNGSAGNRGDGAGQRRCWRGRESRRRRGKCPCCG